jgi:superfamily II DNA or RNA helicase
MTDPIFVTVSITEDDFGKKVAVTPAQYNRRFVDAMKAVGWKVSHRKWNGTSWLFDADQAVEHVHALRLHGFNDAARKVEAYVEGLNGETVRQQLALHFTPQDDGLFIESKYNPDLIKLFKECKGQWSPEHRHWAFRPEMVRLLDSKLTNYDPSCAIPQHILDRFDRSRGTQTVTITVTNVAVLSPIRQIFDMDRRFGKDWVRPVLGFPHPQPRKARKYGNYPPDWDGRVVPVKYNINWRDQKDLGELQFGLAWVPTMKAKLEGMGFRVRVIDRRPTLPLTVKTEFGLDLWECQEGAQAHVVAKLKEMGSCMYQLPTGTGKCITGESLINTDIGLVPIEKITKKHKVITLNRDFETVSPSKWYNEGIQKTIKIKTKMGYSIEGTYEHPIITLNPTGDLEFKRLDEIKYNDYVAIVHSLQTFGKVHNPEMGKLLGLLVGDGSYSSSKSRVNSFSFHNGNRFLLSMFDSLCIKLFHKKCACYDYGNRVPELALHSKEARRELLKLGLKYTTASTKEVPHFILQSTKETVSLFLQGLFDTDGSISKGRVEYSSSSKKLAKQVHILLLNFGIVSSFQPKKSKKHWRVAFSGEALRVFHKEINFSHPDKKRKLRDYIETHDIHSNINILPYNGTRLLQESWIEFVGVHQQNVGQSRIKMAKEKGISRKGLGACFEGKRNPTIRWVKKYCEGMNDMWASASLEKLTNLVNLPIFWDKVVSLKRSEGIVYDLTVPKTHNFVANGFINHNTEVALSVVHQLQVKTIILVDTKDLVRQWRKRIAKRLGVEAGIVGMGQYEPKEITVATIQSLWNYLKAEMEIQDVTGINDAVVDRFIESGKVEDDWAPISPELFQMFSLVILDECHIGAANTYLKVLMAFTAKYFLAQSATTWRSDGWHGLMWSIFHKPEFKLSDDDAVERDRIVPVELHIIDGVTIEEDNYQSAKKKMKESEEANRIIANVVKDAPKPILVLTREVTHQKFMKRAMKQIGLNPIVLNGKSKMELRYSVLDLMDVADPKAEIVIATNIFGKGVDAKGIASVFLVFSTKSDVDVYQWIGRGRRKRENKYKLVVYDIHHHNRHFDRHFDFRLEKVYKKMGWVAE